MTPWSKDPGQVLDELMQKICTGRLVYTALEQEALGGWILHHLAEHPMRLDHLVRWVRLQRPRVLPEAIGNAVKDMAKRGLLEHDGKRWRVKPDLPVKLSLPQVA